MLKNNSIWVAPDYAADLSVHILTEAEIKIDLIIKVSLEQSTHPEYLEQY